MDFCREPNCYCQSRVIKCSISLAILILFIIPTIQHLKAGYDFGDIEHKLLGYLQLAALLAYAHRCLELDIIKYAKKLWTIFRGGKNGKNTDI